MEKTAVQKLAEILKIMMSVVIVCNYIGLFLAAAMAYLSPTGALASLEDNILTALHVHPLGEDDIFIPYLFFALACWGECFHNWLTAVYTVFLFACGCCTLGILRQAKRILNTILEGNPFRMDNARSMKRAAVFCWIISGLALVRLVWELARYGNTAPLYTYNTLFVPAFLMAGLLFQVMSALFRQAAELKEDQDLTI